MESLERYVKPAPAGSLLKWLLPRVIPLLEGMAQRSGTSFDVRWPDGTLTHCGSAAPAFACTLHTNAAVRALFMRSDLRLGESFLRGEIDIEGDMSAMLGLRSFFCDVSLLDHLRQTYLQPFLRGQTRQDKRWIAQHYDESPEFYLAFLDRRHHCYSHGFFDSADESLEDAISRKLQTALDALQLQPGARILDIGAGWGAFTEFGARRGYNIVSLTISRASEDYVRGLIERDGLSAEVKRCHLLEYEDEAGFDGIVNLGVTEHLPDYGRTMQAYTRLLKPGGRVFLDACSSRTKYPFAAFTKRYVWPGNATPMVLHEYLEAVAASPFEVLDVTDDRESYRLTTLAWVRNLEAARSSIVARWGEHQFRRFQLYLWGCVQGFETHQFGAYHLLLEKVDDRHTRELRRRGWARLPYHRGGGMTLDLKNVTFALAVAWAGIPLAHAASAEVEKYPTKPVRLIAPFVPGGGTDITARAIAAKLTERWGQQFIVDNRPGAAGAIGVEVTATAAPDGYTLCLISASHSVNSATNPKLPYDLTKDLQAITQATSLFYVVHVHPSVPAKSIQELITYAKSNPAKLNFGSSGTGGLQHFAGEMINHLGGIKMVHVPYKGGAAATADALGGNIQVGFGSLLSSRAHYKGGRLRPLAITARQRSPTAPEFPTVAESGLPGYEVDQWYGVITSAKVPRPLVDKLSAAIAESLKSPETAQRLAGDGSTPVGSTPDQFQAHIRSEIAKWRKLVKEAKLELH